MTPPPDRGTGLGPLYLRSLLRMHLSISLTYLGLFGLMAFGLPLAFWVFPSVARWRVGPIPLPWLMLGLVGYPVMVLIGGLYVRSVEDAEEEYAELVDEP